MNTGEDLHGMRKIQDLSLWISITLLLIHFYFICYSAFKEWGWTAALSDRLLVNIGKTGLFKTPNRIKLFSLIFLVLSLLGAKGQKDGRIGYSRTLLFLFIGAAVYFGSIFLLALDGTATTIACVYMGTCFTGWMLVLTGGMRLSRAINQSPGSGFFRKEEGGFQQEERLIRTEFSINLKGRYELNGKTRKSQINIINPRRGVLVIGSPGAGKSWFIVEPAMEQLIEKGFSMLILDFKFDTLTRYAHSLFCRNRKKYPVSAGFYVVNFNDLSRSHRCNVINPKTLDSLSDAIGVSRTIMLSLNSTWAHRQGDFFVESPINFLAALIWYLKKYKDGVYCTLPHVIELALTPYEKLFPILSTEPEVQTLINAFIQAYENKTFEMLDGQISSMKIPVGRLASPDLYYVLTGDDVSLDINDPAHPKVLCLGGDPARQGALAPVLSLYIDRLNNLINKPGRYPCALVLDEFASVRATSVLQTMALGRSNNIIPFLVVQDLSQLQILYTKAEADTILNMTGNLICGQVGGETARWISERFPGVVQHRTTVSVNSSDTSVSRSEQSSSAISTATLATLSSGEFVGILADDPGKEMRLKAFHARIVKEAVEDEVGELPVVREISPGEVEENFRRVKREVEELVDGEMRRILKDPVLRGRMGRG